MLPPLLMPRVGFELFAELSHQAEVARLVLVRAADLRFGEAGVVADEAPNVGVGAEQETSRPRVDISAGRSCRGFCWRYERSLPVESTTTEVQGALIGAGATRGLGGLRSVPSAGGFGLRGMAVAIVVADVEEGWRLRSMSGSGRAKVVSAAGRERMVRT